MITQKGRGYGPAEQARDKGHATAKFDVMTGAQQKAASNAPSYTKVFADSLLREAGEDPRICAVTAAMPDGTGLNLFAQRYPSRCFDIFVIIPALKCALVFMVQEETKRRCHLKGSAKNR